MANRRTLAGGIKETGSVTSQVLKELAIFLGVAFIVVRAFWLPPDRPWLGAAGEQFDRVLRMALALLFTVAVGVRWWRLSRDGRR